MRSLTHLERLEAESIHIFREVVAEAENPVMLYSIGKDSAVMLHLAKKAFYPLPPPFPLLHVDTTWKFRDMYAFRERMVKEHGFDLRRDRQALQRLTQAAVGREIQQFGARRIPSRGAPTSRRDAQPPWGEALSPADCPYSMDYHPAVSNSLHAEVLPQNAWYH